MPRLVTVLPIYCTGEAVTYTCLSLVENMRPFGQQTEVWVPTAVGSGRRSFVREAVSPLLRAMIYRLKGESYVIQRLEDKVLKEARPDDIYYVWPATTTSLRKKLKERGHRLVTERINCCIATASKIVEDEYKRLGWQQEAAISQEDIEGERAELDDMDYIFSPSPRVSESLFDLGVEPSRIWESSYGFDPARISKSDDSQLGLSSSLLPPFEGVTFVFVGYACVRKGAHLLFDAFARANMKKKARLVLAGRIAPDIVARYAEFLARDDVISLGYVSDIGAVYRAADVFTFPSLEEGGPMVTYEAMGAGLSVVVSKMGAGAVARHGSDGLIIDPHRVDDYAEALTTLAEDSDLRRSCGDAARERALDFTWKKVAARRQALIESAFGISP